MRRAALPLPLVATCLGPDVRAGLDVAESDALDLTVDARGAAALRAETDWGSDLFYEVLPAGPAVLESGEPPSADGLDRLATADLAPDALVDGVGRVLELDALGVYPVDLAPGERVDRYAVEDPSELPRWVSHLTLWNGSDVPMAVTVRAIAEDAPAPRAPAIERRAP